MFAHVFIIYMYFLGMRAMHIILAIKCPLPTCYICSVLLYYNIKRAEATLYIYMYICLEMQDKNIKVFFLLQRVILGVKVPPQTCQQSIFRILIATQINPRGKRVARRLSTVPRNNCQGGYPRESNCRQFGARNCRENVLTRFHVRVKYVDSHCRRVSDS